mmetsp:Transcript_4399/g.13949  ORF Transcript_4399/g.13949 Transcript_4399/m.13949 type:complete len:144 (-) Transcript_4399:1189-1620(-)
MIKDNHPFHSFLSKVFRRRIKRSKRRSLDDASFEGGGDEDESVTSDDNEEEESENEEVDDSCPAGCDATLYEHVIELREKRLDQETNLAELSKMTEEMKRARDRHIQRKKQIERDLSSFNMDLESFQTEKQQLLNQSVSGVSD